MKNKNQWQTNLFLIPLVMVYRQRHVIMYYEINAHSAHTKRKQKVQKLILIYEDMLSTVLVL